MLKKNLFIIFVISMISLFSLSFILGATNHITSGMYDFLGTDYTDSLIHETDSIMLRVETSVETTCWYTDVQGVSPSNEFEGNYGTKHEAVIEGLEEGVHKYYIVCENASNDIMEFIFKTSIPIYGTIELSEDPPLKGGQYEFDLITSKVPLETPILEYSLDGITKKDVTLSGSGTSWKGYLIIPDNTGEVVGSFSFSAKDLAGRWGYNLIGDNLFIVDTEKPETIATINAIGYEGQVRLNWFYYNDINEFNVYKSENPNIDYTDFYKTTTKEYYTDNNVERGKTYYYRIAGVDEAGNIADLSREVYATALLEGTTSSTSETGLDVQFIGRVDNMISMINALINDIEEIKNAFKSKEGKEKLLFEDLQLEKEINEIVSELNSLIRDVEKYKLQDLTESELNNKLNSADLRINIIKKKTPENLIISDERETLREINEEDIQRALLEYENNEEYNYKKEIDYVFDLAKERNLNIKSKYYNLEIVHMDGSRKDLTVIDDNLESKIDAIENFFFVMIIPKNIAEDASELNVVSGSYEVIKSDPVLAFPSETKRIIYYLDEEVSLINLDQIIISPIKLPEEEKQNSKITGMVISDVFSSGSIGIIILVLFIGGLALYFLKIKRNGAPEKPILELLENVKKVDALLKEKKVEEAKELYSKIREEYKELSKKEKTMVVKEVQKIGGNFSK
jgi:hypothetical protein